VGTGRPSAAPFPTLHARQQRRAKSEYWEWSSSTRRGRQGRVLGECERRAVRILNFVPIVAVPIYFIYSSCQSAAGRASTMSRRTLVSSSGRSNITSWPHVIVSVFQPFVLARS
jgi:hypothetical protein